MSQKPKDESVQAVQPVAEAPKSETPKKVKVIALQRLYSKSTDETHEAGEAYYVDPDMAQTLVAMRLVTLSE